MRVTARVLSVSRQDPPHVIEAGAAATEHAGATEIERLCADLHAEFPEMPGLSRTNLLHMHAFAASWPNPAIVPRLMGG